MSLARKLKRQVTRKLEREQFKGNTLVHGYMVYECDHCGVIYKMYLEQGLEDCVWDAQFPEKHKPVPFTIKCRNCASGMCHHILWGVGDSVEYTELPEGANYFKNDLKEDCGRPIITSPDFLSFELFASEAPLTGEEMFCCMTLRRLRDGKL